MSKNFDTRYAASEIGPSGKFGSRDRPQHLPAIKPVDGAFAECRVPASAVLYRGEIDALAVDQGRYATISIGWGKESTFGSIHKVTF